MNNNPVVRFDIGCRDSKATQRFYGDVFGWSMSKGPHSTEVNTNSEKGIPGSITSLGHEPHQYVMIYIEVDSITKTLDLIKEQGGESHIGPLPTGTGDYFGWAKDPEGNLFGIVSSNE